jgi:phosphate-selective porin OprO/OprP
MRSLWSAVFALGMAGAAAADDDVLPVRLADDAKARRLEELEARLAALEAQQSDEEAIRKLKEQAAKESQDEMKDLPRRVSSLEKSMSSAGQTWDASKMLAFSTPDGNFTAKVGGRFYGAYRHIFNRSDTGNGGAADNFWVDTARVQLDGTFFKDFIYRIELEAKTGDNAGSARLKDTWMGWTMTPAFGVRMGQMKVPFSAEETCSSRFIDFVERSIINRWMPAHDAGVLFGGSLFEKVMDWNLGLFNTSISRDDRRAAFDVQDEKMVAGRIFLSPFTSQSGALKVLRLGVDFTAGDIDNSAQGDISTGDLGGTVLTDFNATTNVDGMRTRIGVNLSWVYGPVSIRGEYAMMMSDFNEGNAESDWDVTMYLVQATWLLTGEAKVLENRIKPNHNFSPLNGHWGAWELAVRFAAYEIGDEVVTGGIAGAAANLEADQITVGVNWWMAPNVVLRLNYEMIGTDQDVINEAGTAVLTDSQDVFILRWQIDF